MAEFKIVPPGSNTRKMVYDAIMNACLFFFLAWIWAELMVSAVSTWVVTGNVILMWYVAFNLLDLLYRLSGMSEKSWNHLDQKERE